MGNKLIVRPQQGLCIVLLRSEKYYLILPSSQADTFSRVVERAAAAVSMSRDWGVQCGLAGVSLSRSGESVPRIDSRLQPGPGRGAGHSSIATLLESQHYTQQQQWS